MTSRLTVRLVILLLALAAFCLAASPTSFCKCTCFSESKIIPLDDSKGSKTEGGRTKSRSCSDCNKQFCLDYNLPICDGASDSDVVTTCFQRDSTKDELIVFIFIFVTAGLLVYAAAKPAFEKWQATRASRRSYEPVDFHEPST